MASGTSTRKTNCTDLFSHCLWPFQMDQMHLQVLIGRYDLEVSEVPSEVYRNVPGSLFKQLTLHPTGRRMQCLPVCLSTCLPACLIPVRPPRHIQVTLSVSLVQLEQKKNQINFLSEDHPSGKGVVRFNPWVPVEWMGECNEQHKTYWLLYLYTKTWKFWSW